mgnify:CR=1 FL=1|tara:strand:+ start:43559 stop:43822 length:264 start_codon:yes stop_codon:yes gene_type:complete
MIKLFDYFKKDKNCSASIAKERLQIIVAHRKGKEPDYMPKLQKELLDVISKYMTINKDEVKVQFDKNEEMSILELNITLPERKQATA